MGREGLQVMDLTLTFQLLSLLLINIKYQLQNRKRT